MRRVVSFFRVHDGNPLTGWHMLAIVGLFFGTIIAVNVAMAIVATGTFPGLVVKNSYVASQNFNELLAESRAQARRGWTADVSAHDGVLNVRLADRGGATLAGFHLSARVGRPASAREDRVLVLTPGGDGYAAQEPLPPGRWLVELEAWDGDDLVYRTTRPLLVEGSDGS